MAVSACLGSLNLFWLILMKFLNSWKNIKMLSFKAWFLIYEVQNVSIHCRWHHVTQGHFPSSAEASTLLLPHSLSRFIPLFLFIITSALTSQKHHLMYLYNSRNFKWEEASLSSWDWLSLFNMVISSCIHFLWSGIASFFRAEKNSIMPFPCCWTLRELCSKAGSYLLLWILLH